MSLAIQGSPSSSWSTSSDDENVNNNFTPTSSSSFETALQEAQKRVLIVGGGPVGLIAGLSALSTDCQVTIKEARPADSEGRPEALFLSEESLKIFDRYGVTEELFVGPAAPGRFLNDGGGTIAICDLEAVLRKTFIAMGGKIDHGWELLAASTDPSVANARFPRVLPTKLSFRSTDNEAAYEKRTCNCADYHLLIDAAGKHSPFVELAKASRRAISGETASYGLLFRVDYHDRARKLHPALQQPAIDLEFRSLAYYKGGGKRETYYAIELTPQIAEELQENDEEEALYRMARRIKDFYANKGEVIPGSAKIVKMIPEYMSLMDIAGETFLPDGQPGPSLIHLGDSAGDGHFLSGMVANNGIHFADRIRKILDSEDTTDRRRQLDRLALESFQRIEATCKKAKDEFIFEPNGGEPNSESVRKTELLRRYILTPPPVDATPTRNNRCGSCTLL